MYGLSSGSKNMIPLQSERKHALEKANGIAKVADAAARALTADESAEFELAMTAAKSLAKQIEASEAKNTIRLARRIPEGATRPNHFGEQQNYGEQKTFSAAYYEDFYEWIGSGGQTQGANLYEAGSATGGWAVPVMVDGNIVPLAPQEMAVRQVATVIPTVMDIKIPQKGSFGTAAIKNESGASPVNFQEVDPTISQITLSAC